MGNGGCLLDREQTAIWGSNVAEADKARAFVQHVCEIAEELFVLHFGFQLYDLNAVLLLQRIGEPIGANMLE